MILGLAHAPQKRRVFGKPRGGLLTGLQPANRCSGGPPERGAPVPCEVVVKSRCSDPLNTIPTSVAGQRNSVNSTAIPREVAATPLLG